MRIYCPGLIPYTATIYTLVLSMQVTFYPRDDSMKPFDLQIYVGNASNPYFLGPAKVEDIAWQIANAEGPSGKNTEYLFELAKAMKELVPEEFDTHLFELEHEVRRICSEKG